jgi:hypothetical protein
MSPVILSAQGITIETGAYMYQSGGTMVVKGNWENNGAFTANAGTAVFSDTAQIIRGSSLSTFNNLTIEASNVVSIDTQANVTVSGTLTNNAGNAGFVIKSAATVSGSLINNTAGVVATSQRYMTANRWHVISTPVSGQSIPVFLADADNSVPTSGNNYGMMYYDEAGGGWVYYTTTSVGNYSVGSGYLTRHTNNDAVSFQGTLNADVANIAITRGGNGWNCIGNPFPCSIGVMEDATSTDNFLDYNAAQLDPSYAVLYLWDEPATRVAGVNYYGVISNAGYSGPRPLIDQAYLQPGQGFIVKSKTGGGTVSFTRTMRLHENTGSYFKSARAPWPGLDIVVSSATKTASTSLTFENRMTPGLDVTYDAGLYGGDANFRIYSRLAVDNGINFMLQCLPETNFENLRIPLGFDCKDGGTVTFSNEFVSLPPGLEIYLEDSLMGMYTSFDVPNAIYTATVNPNASGIGRFYLNLNNTIVTSAPKTDFSDLNIYAYQKQIIVKGPIARSTRLNLYDLAGRIVKSYNLKPGNLNVLPVNNLHSGVYVVKLYGKNNNENKRVFLE